MRDDEILSTPSATNFVSPATHLSERRTTWNYIKALMWKNALLKRRHLKG
ncbi:Abc transporter a family member 1, partial [Globisporangium polare]